MSRTPVTIAFLLVCAVSPLPSSAMQAERFFFAAVGNDVGGGLIAFRRTGGTAGLAVDAGAQVGGTVGPLEDALALYVDLTAGYRVAGRVFMGAVLGVAHQDVCDDLVPNACETWHPADRDGLPPYRYARWLRMGVAVVFTSDKVSLGVKRIRRTSDASARFALMLGFRR